ncbi:MAG TPA: SIMPL domain-containing protein [Pirellulales bacterium]|nr:SIMPL domain-containing protein [Pirellulales bacterium]
MKIRTAVCYLALGTILGAAGPAQSLAQVAQTGSVADGIAVYGTGEASERPNLVEIDLHVIGKAELTGDALVKHRDAKKRVLESLDKLKIPMMSIEDLALSISVGSGSDAQQRMVNGMVQTPGKPQVEVTSSVRIKLASVRDTPPEELIKTVGRLMDVAQDSGVNVGPSPAEVMRNLRFGQPAPNSTPVRFVLTDLNDLREKAYERAVADAQNRASRLAKLHHVKLGSALSIQEVSVGGDQALANSNQNNSANSMPQLTVFGWQNTGSQQSAPGEGEGEPRIASNYLSGMAVQVRLLVRFAIHPAEPATAQQ